MSPLPPACGPGVSPDPKPTRLWHHVRVEVVDIEAGVHITLWIDDVAVLEATDAGEIGEPFTGPTGVSVRGDNLEFGIDNVAVTAP